MGQQRSWIVVGAGSLVEQRVPINGRLSIGRECHGVAEDRRLILPDTSISRDHLEVRCTPGQSPTLTDRSTNGTVLNGRRVERGETIELHDGDVITLGASSLLFHHIADAGEQLSIVTPRTTIRSTSAVRLAVVVGDIVGYTGMTESHGGQAVARVTEPLFAALHQQVVEHRGTVINYGGDSIMSAWDADWDPGAAAAAVRFALAADALVTECAATLPVGDRDGQRVQMGWAVTIGEAAMAHPTPARGEIHGDAVTLAFRIAGLAAREGHEPVLVTSDVAVAAPAAAAYGPEIDVEARGRRTPARLQAARSKVSIPTG
jgi:adenylate cyclase